MGWPILSEVKRRITKGPAAKPINSAVIAAITARKVMYWKTRKKPHSGDKLCNHWARLSSMGLPFFALIVVVHRGF